MLEELKYWIQDNSGIVKLAVFIVLIIGAVQWRGHCVNVYEEQKHPDSIRKGLIFILKNIPSNWTDSTTRQRITNKNSRDGTIKSYQAHDDKLGIDLVIRTKGGTDIDREVSKDFPKIQTELYKGDTVTTIKKKSLILPFQYLEVDVKKPIAFLTIPKSIRYEATFETIEPEKTLKRKGAQNALEYMRAKGLRCRLNGNFDAKTKILTAELHLNSMSVYHVETRNVLKARYLGDGKFEMLE